MEKKHLHTNTILCNNEMKYIFKRSICIYIYTKLSNEESSTEIVFVLFIKLKFFFKIIITRTFRYNDCIFNFFITKENFFKFNFCKISVSDLCKTRGLLSFYLKKLLIRFLKKTYFFMENNFIKNIIIRR